MAATAALWDRTFKRVGAGTLDKKSRVLLTKALDTLRSLFGDDLSELRFEVASNAAGQILLSPVAPVPAHEAWLYKNPDALARVRTGLGQAARGELRNRGSFAKYAKSDLDK